MLNNKQGFTLIELIVTMAIIVILLAVSIPAFRSFGQANQLYRTSQDIKALVELARSSALAPSTGKTAGVDKYKIIFSQSEKQIAFYEDDLANYLEVIKLPSDYQWKFYSPLLETASSEVIVYYLITDQGKVSSIQPEITTSEIKIGLKDTSLAENEDEVIITINKETGLIFTGQLQ